MWFSFFVIESMLMNSSFSCTGIKYIGDPVDGIRFKSGQYRKDRLKNISFNLSQEDPEAIDTVDVDARNNFKGKKMPEVESPVKDRTLGFDLMSLTSRRGHYVDHVRIVAIVVRIDMDLLKQVLIYVKMRLITRTATIFQFLETRTQATRIQK